MKIAVFWPNWIGDAVMATAAVRALRQHFASADFIGVLKPYIGGVLEGSPWMDRLIFLDNRGPWELRWPAVAQQLRKEQVDLAILFPNSFRAALDLPEFYRSGYPTLESRSRRCQPHEGWAG